MNNLMRALDEVDYLLLAFLQKRVIRPAQLSERLKRNGHTLGANACRNRVEELESAGFIKRYVALLDPAQLDLYQVCFVLVRFGDKSEEMVAAFKKQFLTDHRILEFHEVFGPNDFLLKVRVRNNEEALNFSQELKPFVGSVESILAAKTHKEQTELPLSILTEIK